MAVLAVFLGATHPLWRGRAVALWDAGNQAFPYFVLVADHARAGQLVQWDPWTEAGLPLGGEPQAGAYSPIVVGLGLIGGGRPPAFIAYWLLSWALGGVGILALARHLGAPGWGGCAVALGFLFCGVYTGNAEHISWVASFSFVPLMLWRLDAALVRRSARAAAHAGALWGLAALAGHPAIIILAGCYAALWTLGRLNWGQTRIPSFHRTSSLTRAVEGPQGDPDHPTGPGFDSAARSRGFLGSDSYPTPIAAFERGVRLTGAVEPSLGRREDVSERGFGSAGLPSISPVGALRALALVFAVGVVVLSPTYVSTLRDGAGVHSRSGPLPRSEAVTDEFPPGGLVTIASAYPARAKSYFLDSLWPRSDVSMVSVYAGVLIPVLAVFALLTRPRDRWRWWIAGLAVFSLACAMGESLPFHGWLYDWFYPIRYFRHSSVFRLFYVISVTALALIGTRELALALEERDGRRRHRFAIAAWACALAAAVAYAGFLVGIRHLGFSRLAPALAALWLGPVVLGVYLVRARPPRRRVPMLTVLLAVADAIVASVVSQRTVFDTRAEVIRWQALDRAHDASLDLAPHGLERVGATCDGWDPTRWCNTNDQLITKTAVQYADATFRNRVYAMFLRDSTLRAMAAGRDRIWFSPVVAEVPRTDSAMAAFLGIVRESGVPRLVVHARAQMLQQVSTDAGTGTDRGVVERRVRALPAARRIAARVLGYRPNELTLVVSAPEQGWLLVTDRRARGWRATVNGRRTEVLGGVFLYRAVPVAAGPNTVRFTYRAAGFPFLVIASWGTLALVLVGSARRARRV